MPLKYPYQVQIESFGSEGFSFKGMTCKTSLLALPSGMKIWENTDDYEMIFDEKIDFIIIGSGKNIKPFPPILKSRLRALGISSDIMATPQAKATYNIMLEERRAVAGAFIFP